MRILRIVKTGILLSVGAFILIFTGTGGNDMDVASATESEIKKNLPGIHDFHEDLLKKFDEKKKRLGESYKPRTKHLDKNRWATYTNRLFLESSPYLLQHAHNPVNWYPWGEEAFETARKLIRPVMVSIGYSTCHWCHVMEEESFEDVEIAEFLNEYFISVKVDREERPDIDSIYMAALQALTGRGGWPLNVWLTPDKKPFYGGTYFPARDGDRGVGAGFITVLKKLDEVYHSQPEVVSQTSTKLTQAIREMLAPGSGTGIPQSTILHTVIKNYKNAYDPVFGGITGAPKFPSSLPARLLLRYYRRAGDKKVLEMAEKTLAKMSAGGMYDHVGGGFHRYATDEKWLVPHFEKMLYDNALLSIAYIEGYQVTGRKDFIQVAQEILDYVKREMTSPEGVFYSATDADSKTPEGHREEGYYFTWTPDELEKVLGKVRANVIRKYYSVGPVPNFEGRFILHTVKTKEDISKELDISVEELNAIIAESREMLYQERNKRPLPLRDDKILAAWNGLMISAYAKAGFVLDESGYTDIAVTAATSVLEKLFIDNKLYRSYKDNKAKNIGYLQDYTFFIASLLDIYEATQDISWLEKAIKLDNVLENHYEDKENGGYFLISDDQEALIAREKPGYDGAIPSGNSVAVQNLFRLNKFTTKDEYRKKAEKSLQTFLGSSNSSPVSLSEMLLSLDFYLDKPKEIIIVTPEGKESDAKRFVDVYRKQFNPNSVLTVVQEGEELKKMAVLIPSLKGKDAIKGKSTAYVCESGLCKLPVDTPEAFSKQISTVEPYMN